ncbi:MAG TPA: DUF4239 domain-containing protein [Rubrobacter sp.]|nr:DUF4239 domain-containing protein [Rubrobacter sp.]
MALSVGGLALVQRLVPTALRAKHNEVAGFIYAVLGVAYAVLLGLMLVAVWEQWNAAAETADDEASSLAEIFWIAHQLPDPEGRRIQELARSYARTVEDEEWPLMEQGKASPKAWSTLDEIRDDVQKLGPSTSTPQVLYEQELERVHDLADARRGRLLSAEEGLPAILWVVLIVGGVVVVCFTYLFGLENTSVHLLMVAALALIIALVLFSVAALDHPFRGDVRIAPNALEQVLGRFESSKLSDL